MVFVTEEITFMYLIEIIKVVIRRVWALGITQMWVRPDRSA